MPSSRRVSVLVTAILVPLLGAACSSAGDPSDAPTRSSEEALIGIVGGGTGGLSWGTGSGSGSGGGTWPPPTCTPPAHSPPPSTPVTRNQAFYPFPGDFDGDGRADLAVYSSPQWPIDFAADGFGSYVAYGAPRDHRFSWPITTPPAMPVPADYDHDGKMDIAVKDNGGRWYVDESHDGFGAWNDTFAGYGDNSGVPAPADFDGDGHADISIWGYDGVWRVDLWKDGLSSWNFQLPGYGNAGLAVPADYNGDGYADLALVTGGRWFIDYASPLAPNLGLGGWNEIVTIPGGTGGILPAPADYDGDGKTDLATLTPEGRWSIDYAANGFKGWERVIYVAPDAAAVPAPADYDHDHRADLATQNAQSGLFDIDRSSNGLGSLDVAVTLDNTLSPRATSTANLTCGLAPYSDDSFYAAVQQAGVQYGFSCAPPGAYYSDVTAPGFGEKAYYAVCTNPDNVRVWLARAFYGGDAGSVPTNDFNGPILDANVGNRCLAPAPAGHEYLIWPEGFCDCTCDASGVCSCIQRCASTCPVPPFI